MLPVTNSASSSWTVSQLNLSIRQLLEEEVGQVWLIGEISNFAAPTSGHWYFTLKDSKSQVRCAMFKNSNSRAQFLPQNGLKVVILAQVTLYEPRGDYQLIAERIQPAGEGELQQRFEQLKQKLAEEGLFDQQRKKILPVSIQTVGIITSSTGAALHDILNVLKRRNPALSVVIYPTQVQGSEATVKISNMIELANQRAECDVLIVGRGGGSLEDLWCFNEEIVARTIAASRLPIISAVGHESDVTIADFVADIRAATPSVAAELVSRDQADLLRQLKAQQMRFEMAMDYYLERCAKKSTQLFHRLQQQHPALRLSQQKAKLLALHQLLQTHMQKLLQKKLRTHQNQQQRLYSFQPAVAINRLQTQLQQCHYRMQLALVEQLNRAKQQFSIQATRLEASSPLAILARGYSITLDKNGQVLKQSAYITPGDRLKTQFNDGWVESTVISVNNK